MNRNIESMIAPDIKSAGSVVQRKSELDQRAPGSETLQKLPEGPKRSNVLIPDDPFSIVKNEGPAEAVGIYEQSRSNDYHCSKYP